jgi:RNA polymerase sigma-70 factor (ECF subfamily)
MTIPDLLLNEKTDPPATARAAATPQELFDLHFEAVYRFFSRRVRDLDDVQDLAAETFAAAVQARLPRHVEPLCWLYGIARRKLADFYRRKKRTASISAPSPQGGDTDIAIELRALIDRLPARQKEALLLQALEGLKVTDIAQVMGCSTTGAKALLQRAKEQVRLQSKGQFDPMVNS